MTSETKNIKTYKINSDYSNLEELREFIINESKSIGFNDEDAYLISLAVDEACTNLIRYAYKFDSSKKIEINLYPNNNKIVVIIRDSGKPFNPLDVPPPNMQEYFDEFKRGGLGIFIIRKAMDEVIYKSASSQNIFNELRLIKKLV